VHLIWVTPITGNYIRYLKKNKKSVHFWSTNIADFTIEYKFLTRAKPKVWPLERGIKPVAQK